MAEAEALQELEDEIPGQDDMAKAEDAERERMKAALFGEDEEEDLGAEAAALEEEMDGEGGEEAAPAAGPSSQSQRREMLKALAKKRKADEVRQQRPARPAATLAWPNVHAGDCC